MKQMINDGMLSLLRVCGIEKIEDDDSCPFTMDEIDSIVVDYLRDETEEQCISERVEECNRVRREFMASPKRGR